MTVLEGPRPDRVLASEARREAGRLRHLAYRAWIANPLVDVADWRARTERFTPGWTPFYRDLHR